MQPAASNDSYKFFKCVRSNLTNAARYSHGAACHAEARRRRVSPCSCALRRQSASTARGGYSGLCLTIIAMALFSVIQTQAQETTLRSRGGEPGVTIEEVIVTGSNIPTAEEVGPNPVDTYRPEDIEKLGIRNATDLQTFLAQEAGAAVNLNGTFSDGTVELDLRGALARETLVLVDGKRVAFGSLARPGDSNGANINLIPFSMIDHVDILKDGASAVYGSDAIAGVVNFFLIHKFRGLEIGGTYGNTNLGASNDMGEWEAWLKAGTGDDKTDLVVIADFWERTGGISSRDRHLSANANFRPFGGLDARSDDSPGFIDPGFRLIPKLFFSPNSPPAHSAPNVSTSPYYTNTVPYPDGNFTLYNFAAVTSALPPADRQAYYGSFTRDLCHKYLTIFADFKYVRTYFDSSLAAVPFAPDPLKQPGTNIPFSQFGISVPIQNPFNPFTVADATIANFFPDGSGLPVTTGVRFRGISDARPTSEKFTYWDTLFDVGLRGEMAEFGDYFKTWNWETGFRYSRNVFAVVFTGDAANNANTTIYKFTPDGGESVFAALSGQGIGLATDAANNLYVTLDPPVGNAEVLKITPGGSQSVVAVTSDPTVLFDGIAFDSSGSIFISAAGNPGGDKILKFTSGVESTFANGLNTPRGLAFDSLGNLYVAEAVRDGDILVFTPGGVGSVFASGLARPEFLTFGPAR